jgi:hypothetical protein
MAAALAAVVVATVALVVCADGLRTGVVASGRRRKRRRRREERPGRPEDRLCAGMEAGRRTYVTPKGRVEGKGREAGDIGRRGKARGAEGGARRGREREGLGHGHRGKQRRGLQIKGRKVRKAYSESSPPPGAGSGV